MDYVGLTPEKSLAEKERAASATQEELGPRRRYVDVDRLDLYTYYELPFTKFKGI